MWPVTVRQRAEADLENARDWYEQRREGLGREFLLAARLAVERIRANPDIEGERIIVFRVLHFRQDHPQHLG